MLSTQSFISLQGVVKTYESLAGKVVALQDITLQVDQGEFVVISGKSGAGKTTLVNVLTGLDRVAGGEIWVDGVPLHTYGQERAAKWRGQMVGVVFQSFELMPTLTVLQNVMLPMDFAGLYTWRKRRARALALLEQVGIAEHARKLPAAVSGGQQQRVAVARALANDPALIVADEPTGSLDSVTTEAILKLFAKLVATGKTVVLVTHDKDVVKYGTQIVTLSDGKIIEEWRTSC